MELTNVTSQNPYMVNETTKSDTAVNDVNRVNNQAETKKVAESDVSASTNPLKGQNINITV